jgi:hypothetical protein
VHKERFVEIQNSINAVLGGYPNYVYLLYDPAGSEEDAKPLFDRLTELEYKPEVKQWTIAELEKYKSCLSGSDPGGWRTPTTYPYSICLESLESVNRRGNNFTEQSIFHAHEYFHHYQRAHALERGTKHTAFNDETPESTLQTPMWWSEGTAMAFEVAWYKSNWDSLSFLEGGEWGFAAEKYNDKSTPRAYKRIRKMAQGLLPRNLIRPGCTSNWKMTVLEEELNRYTDKDGHKIKEDCEVTVMAVYYMAYLTSWKTVWIDIPQDYYDLGFWGAVEKHLGMTKQEFFDAYNEFLRSGDPEARCTRQRILVWSYPSAFRQRPKILDHNNLEECQSKQSSNRLSRPCNKQP